MTAPKRTGPKLPVDRAGERHGKLLVVSLARTDPWRQRIWLCQCDECGGTREIRADLLGRWPNCGCIARHRQTRDATLMRMAKYLERKAKGE